MQLYRIRFKIRMYFFHAEGRLESFITSLSIVSATVPNMCQTIFNTGDLCHATQG